MINAMPLWWWAVYALAVVRLTGLVAADELTRPVREALISRLDSRKRWHRSVAYLVGGATDDGQGCPWCLSIWISAIVVPIAWYQGDQDWAILPAFILALSQVTGMIAAVGRG